MILAGLGHVMACWVYARCRPSHRYSEGNEASRLLVKDWYLDEEPGSWCALYSLFSKARRRNMGRLHSQEVSRCASCTNTVNWLRIAQLFSR